jgi:hypothetical protein
LQAIAFGGGLNATISGGHFSNIRALMGIAVLANSSLQIRDTVITNNTIAKGAVYVSYSGSLSALDNVTLSGNTAAEGPALYIVQGAAVITNSILSNNTAERGGGSMYVKASSNVTMHNTILAGNTAGSASPLQGCGGAMHVTDSNISISQSTFSNNTATSCAGAIYLGLDTGGATPHDTEVCRYNFPRQGIITGSKFEANAAPAGGALGIYTTAVVVDNCTFKANSARPTQAKALQDNIQYFLLGNGGAVYTDNAVLSIINSSLVSNQAVMDGGECAHTLSLSVLHLDTCGPISKAYCNDGCRCTIFEVNE